MENDVSAVEAEAMPSSENGVESHGQTLDEILSSIPDTDDPVQPAQEVTPKDTTLESRMAAHGFFQALDR